MTDLRKAAEMALEALEMTRVVFKVDDRDYGLSRASNAADTLRQALAQPEYQTMSAPQPQTFTGQNPYTADDITAVVEAIVTAFNLRREWVGLTDEEIDAWGPLIQPVVRAIEAKLKEKNT